MSKSVPVMRGLEHRTPLEQARVNLQQALRILDLLAAQPSTMVPHPVVVLRAEIKNAIRYLSADAVT